MSSAGIPRYKKVVDSIISQINSDKFTVGQKLPSDRELASQLRVSPVTVSKAYNLLAEKGYLRRIQGAGTFVASKNKKTGTVVFMTSKTDKRWTGVIAAGFSKVMADNGYDVRLAPDFESDPIKEKRFLDNLDSDKTDGIFVFSRFATEKYYLELCEQKDIKVLLGGGSFRWLPYVTFDDYRIGQLAAKYLIEQGCKSFAVITEDFDAGRERLYGFREEIARAGYSVPAERIIWARQSMYLTREEIDEIVNRWSPFPDGIFAHGDSYLVNLYHQYLKGVARVRDDTVLVGVGNDFEHHHIPFTSVDYNLYGLGEIAGEYMLDLLDGNADKTRRFNGESQRRCPEPSLRVRKSKIKDYVNYEWQLEGALDVNIVSN